MTVRKHALAQIPSELCEVLGSAINGQERDEPQEDWLEALCGPERDDRDRRFRLALEKSGNLDWGWVAEQVLPQSADATLGELVTRAARLAFASLLQEVHITFEAKPDSLRVALYPAEMDTLVYAAPLTEALDWLLDDLTDFDISKISHRQQIPTALMETRDRMNQILSRLDELISLAPRLN